MAYIGMDVSIWASDLDASITDNIYITVPQTE